MSDQIIHRKKIENILSLDLEMNQPSNTIIQVGYVIGNIQTGEILKEVCINTYTDETIADQISALTGIKQSDVEQGVHLDEAYIQICKDRMDFNCFMNPLTWGGGDSAHLRKELKIGDDESYTFGRRWIDCKTLYISYAIANDLNFKGGLSKSMTRFGINFAGRKHNAMDDAKNTFILYHRLIDEIRGNSNAS